MEGDVKFEASEVHVWFVEKLWGNAVQAAIKNDRTFRVPNLERASYDIAMADLPQDFYLKSILADRQDVTGTSVDLTKARLAT